MTAPDQISGRFNFRVAGICLHAGHVLLHQAADDNFWSMPGGRPELLEPSAVALAREFREELGLACEIGRLLWVVESFFQFDGIPVQELCLYYACQLPADCGWLDVAREYQGIEAAPVLRFRWFPLDQLEQSRLFPSFLRTELRCPPATTTHRVHTDVDELATRPPSPTGDSDRAG